MYLDHFLIVWNVLWRFYFRMFKKPIMDLLQMFMIVGALTLAYLIMRIAKFG